MVEDPNFPTLWSQQVHQQLLFPVFCLVLLGMELVLLCIMLISEPETFDRGPDQANFY